MTRRLTDTYFVHYIIEVKMDRTKQTLSTKSVKNIITVDEEVKFVYSAIVRDAVNVIKRVYGNDYYLGSLLIEDIKPL